MCILKTKLVSNAFLRLIFKNNFIYSIQKINKMELKYIILIAIEEVFVFGLSILLMVFAWKIRNLRKQIEENNTRQANIPQLENTYSHYSEPNLTNITNNVQNRRNNFPNRQNNVQNRQNNGTEQIATDKYGYLIPDNKYLTVIGDETDLTNEQDSLLPVSTNTRDGNAEMPENKVLGAATDLTDKETGEDGYLLPAEMLHKNEFLNATTDLNIYQNSENKNSDPANEQLYVNSNHRILTDH